MMLMLGRVTLWSARNLKEMGDWDGDGDGVNDIIKRG